MILFRNGIRVDLRGARAAVYFLVLKIRSNAMKRILLLKHLKLMGSIAYCLPFTFALKRSILVLLVVKIYTFTSQ